MLLSYRFHGDSQNLPYTLVNETVYETIVACFQRPRFAPPEQQIDRDRSEDEVFGAIVHVVIFPERFEEAHRR